MITKSLSFIAILAASFSALSGARGAVVVTYAENPGQETTSLSQTNVYDFNSLKTGLNTNISWSGVGTIDQLYVLKADQYGGATDATHPNGTNYSVEGVNSPVKTTTLTLKEDSGYFGFWWSAGDASNMLSFYNNGNLVAQFTTASLLKPLGSEYDGNPRNKMLDSNEPFAFINFYGDANTTWDQIVFGNSSASGFESDNWTSRVSTYDPTVDGPVLSGTVVSRVSGKTTTMLSSTATGEALWGSKSGIPGAPLPPPSMLAAFGLALVAKGRKAVKRIAGSEAV